MPSSTFRLIHDNVDRSLLRQRSCCTCESSLVLLSLTTSRSDALAVNLARVVFGDSETRAACVYTALRDKRSSVTRGVPRILAILVEAALHDKCSSVARGVSRILATLVNAASRAKHRCCAARVALLLLRCLRRAVGESLFNLE